MEMCDPSVSLELQKTAENLIYETDTQGKCQMGGTGGQCGFTKNLA